MYVCICICICVYVCVCVCVYIYIHTHTYIYIYIHTHIHNSVTIQRNKDYKSHWKISNKGTNREYDKNIHQKNKQYLKQGIIF